MRFEFNFPFLLRSSSSFFYLVVPESQRLVFFFFARISTSFVVFLRGLFVKRCPCRIEVPRTIRLVSAFLVFFTDTFPSSEKMLLFPEQSSVVLSFFLTPPQPFCSYVVPEHPVVEALRVFSLSFDSPPPTRSS